MERISSHQGSFKCPDRYKLISTKFALIAHRRVHSNKNKNTNAVNAEGRNIYICKGCKREYKYHKSYVDHMSKCTKYNNWKKNDELKHKKLMNISGLNSAENGGVIQFGDGGDFTISDCGKGINE